MREPKNGLLQHMNLLCSVCWTSVTTEASHTHSDGMNYCVLTDCLHCREATQSSVRITVVNQLEKSTISNFIALVWPTLQQERSRHIKLRLLEALDDIRVQVGLGSQAFLDTYVVGPLHTWTKNNVCMFSLIVVPNVKTSSPKQTWIF